jgi:hypothetical protein
MVVSAGALMDIKTLGNVYSDNNPFHTVFGYDRQLSNSAKKLGSDEVVAYSSQPGFDYVQLVFRNTNDRSRLIVNP